MTIHRPTLRKLTILFLTLTLCWTTVACGGGTNTTTTVPSGNQNQNAPARTVSTNTKLNAGAYGVQQARYNDANGEYNLILIDTPPGTPSNFRTTDLQMARLTPEEISAGKKSYLKVEDNGQTSLHLAEDFKIEYIHAVTETRQDPQTGQPQTVIVRQESGGFWAPFAGAVAGSVVGNMLFRPQYYVPPVYQPGVSVMTGYGGYGRNYDQAVGQYQARYNQPPAAVRNRPAYLRTTGNLRNSGRSTYDSPRSIGGNRNTGSGYGSRNLRQSGKSSYERRSPSFGSSGGSSGFGSGRSSGFGSRSGGFRRR